MKGGEARTGSRECWGRRSAGVIPSRISRVAVVPFLLVATVVGLGSGELLGADLFEEGRRSFYSGDPARAVELLSAYLRINPQRREARILLARSLAAAGRMEDAVEELVVVLRQNPDDADALFYLAALGGALTQQSHARLQAMPGGQPWATLWLAEALQGQSRWQEAEAEYRKALASRPDLVEARLGLADTLRAVGRFEEAAAEYETVLREHPRQYLAWYGLGVARRFQERREEALRCFERAVTLAPDDAAGRLAFGTELARAGRLEEAVVQLRAAIRREPEMDQAYFQLGRVLQRLGRLEEAKVILEQARVLRLKNLERFR